MSETTRFLGSPPRWLVYVLFLGLFLTLRGYRSREGDQAYRLPLFIDRQDARPYAKDPFVRSFDAFNPHRGYLGLLEVVSGPIGLSAALVSLFGATFLLTCFGVDRLASGVWSDPGAGLVAAGLVFVAQAGNIGTNHLFEPILLDRLIAFSLGWCALAFAVTDLARGLRWAAVMIGLAGLVHPSLGLQVGILMAATSVAWVVLGASEGVRWIDALGTIALLALAVVPGCLLNLGRSSRILEGLPADEFWKLSVELQSPQHMLPHLWRKPQWLAAGCYPLLAILSIMRHRATEPGRRIARAPARLLVLLMLLLAGLAVAWIGIDRFHSLRLALFQPFRLATIARGICLVFLAGYCLELWRRRALMPRLRAVLIVAGLTGDWTLVVVSAFEAVMAIGDLVDDRPRLHRVATLAGFGVLAFGIAFLARHDTESGHVPLIVVIVNSVVLLRLLEGSSFRIGTGRLTRLVACAWVVPVAALFANLSPEEGRSDRSSWREALVRRCRFTARPIDDVERLAVWCREHTPVDARFIGPPGAKTFRLWAERSLAFNRAGSPYHARGLADWARRFQDHVGFEGSSTELVEAYLRDRHGLERRYDELGAAGLARLADQQGAEFAISAAPGPRGAERGCEGPLEAIHVEGRYAVYRLVRPIAETELDPALSSSASTVTPVPP